MKKVNFLILASLLTGFFAPVSASALSCMPDQEMAKIYAEDSRYTMVVAAPQAEREYITARSKMNPDDYDGYTAQHLKVSKVLKGGFSTEDWVYFHKDQTWGYMCVSNPPEIGSEMVYVVNKSDQFNGLDMVVSVYAVDSETVNQIIALSDDGIEPALFEVDKGGQANLLLSEIKRLITVIRIKMDEWRFWNVG